MQKLRDEDFLADKNTVMTERDYAEALKAEFDIGNSVRVIWVQP